MPAKFDLLGEDALTPGEDWVCVVTLPSDVVTGATIIWQCRETESSPATLYSLTTAGSAGIVINSATQFTATIPAATSTLITKYGRFPYDVRVTWASTLKEVVLFGVHEVRRAVSR